MFKIDKYSRVPLYEQVVDEVESHIRLGTFKEEETLPSVRSLATSLGVNPNTLQKAYAELERRGLCVSSPGSGRFVARHARELLLVKDKEKLKDLFKMAKSLHSAGIREDALIECVKQACKEGEQND